MGQSTKDASKKDALAKLGKEEYVLDIGRNKCTNMEQTSCDAMLNDAMSKQGYKRRSVHICK